MNPLVSLGLWLIEHLSRSDSRHALCGDLLQQRHSGRSAAWLTREILIAILHALQQRCGRWTMPLFFATVWSMLYRAYAQPEVGLVLTSWSRVLDASLFAPMLQLLLQILPVVSFLWLGLAVFVSVRRDILGALRFRTVVHAFSSSHAALLLLVLVWPKHTGHLTLVPLLLQPTFYLGWINLPLAISLLIAILCVLPSDGEPPSRRRRLRIAVAQPVPGAHGKPVAGGLMLLVLCGMSSFSRAQADRRAQVEQCTLPAVHVAGQPPACVPLQTRMAQLHVHGVSVAVIHNGIVEWARGYGEAAPGTPVRPDTLFQAGSISKPLAAMAALRLVQQGHLLLDSDVNTWLRSWKVPADPAFPGATVTLRELLTHTAGLTVHGFPGYAAGDPVPDLIHVLNGAPPANTPAIRLEHMPGTQWQYSGGGYTVMQQLLMDTTGQPFSPLLQSMVLGPIGMTHSTYDQPLSASWLAHAAVPFLVNGEPLPGGAHTYPEQAAAGLWTTSSDLALYVMEVQRSLQGKANHVLSQANTQQMLTPGKGTWSLGLQIGGSAGNLYFSHGGVNAGFESVFVGYTHTGDGAVVMTNAQGGTVLAEEVLRGIAAAYGWPDFHATERSAVAVSPATLARNVGTFSLPGGPAYVISLENGHLYATAPSGLRSELFAQSPTAFFLQDAAAELHFNPDAEGKVNELTIRFQGQNVAFPRTR